MLRIICRAAATAEADAKLTPFRTNRGDCACLSRRGPRRRRHRRVPQHRCLRPALAKFLRYRSRQPRSPAVDPQFSLLDPRIRALDQMQIVMRLALPHNHAAVPIPQLPENRHRHRKRKTGKIHQPLYARIRRIDNILQWRGDRLRSQCAQLIQRLARWPLPSKRCSHELAFSPAK